jgi:hypothetical protein
MAGIEKIQYKGKEILYINYQGCRSDEEMIKILKEAQAIIIQDNKVYFQLTDLRNTFATPGYMKAVKEVAKETPRLAKKRAILGIDSPARLILLKAYNLILGSETAIKPFKSFEEAKDWLVS